MGCPLVVLWLATTPATAREVIVTGGSRRDLVELRGPHVGFAEGGRDGHRHLVVDAEGLAAIEAAGLAWTDAPAPPDGVPPGYTSPEAAIERLAELADAHPDRVQLVHAGDSRAGRPIYGVRISETSDPAFHWRVLGAHHGDELISAEVALALATLAADPDGPLGEPLARGALWVLPHVNPDGVAEVARHNAADVDLNRNYGYRWSPDEFHPGDHPFSEPESRAVRALTLRGLPVLGLSLHSGASNLGWVWNHSTVPTPEAEHLEQLALAYADLCTVEGFWVTNGASWYPTNGDTNDWSYGRLGVWDYTLELSTTKTPDAARLAELTAAHLDPIVDFFVGTPLLTGQVVDAETGRPLRATVERAGGGRPVLTGDSGRFALVGTADTPEGWWVAAPGYTPTWVETAAGLAEVPLQRAMAPVELTVWPPVGVAGAQVALARVEAPLPFTVQPPGHRPLWVEGAGDPTDLTGLPPGAWPVAVDGRAARLPWLVDGADAVPLVETARLDNDLVLTFEEGTTGREVWLYGDGHRLAQWRVPHTDPQVEVELSGTGSFARVDVAVWGPGGPTWVADAWGPRWTARAGSPGTAGLDTGLHGVWPGDVTACGCASAPRVPILLMWAGLLACTRRRPQ